MHNIHTNKHTAEENQHRERHKTRTKNKITINCNEITESDPEHMMTTRIHIYIHRDSENENKRAHTNIHQ